MSDRPIPDDVMKAAQDIASLIPSKVRDENRTFAALVIARAIMAERERCALIADGFEEDTPGSCERADDPSGAGASWAAERIAAAIRGEG